MAASRLTTWLEKTQPWVFNAYSMLAAFGAYFCMYGFRKPFSAGTFEQMVELPLLPDMQLKILLIISQVCGYTLSKFIGIKVVSEMGTTKRAIAIAGLILWAELALLLFAVVPAPYSAICLFLNGLPLGMIWGLVFAFLEGRRSTELLGAGLSASYIVASGAVKTVAKWVMSLGVSETWMPFVTGLLFLIPISVCVHLLRRLPPPSPEDERLRVKRQPMDSASRWAFFKTFAPGLIALTALYMLLTAYRNFRDDFAVELWAALGYGDEPEIFTVSEIPIALVVMVTLALLMIIKSNRKALVVVHLIMLAGMLLVGASTFAYQVGMLDPAVWMMTVGLGLYLGYVPFGSMLFDRLIACVGLSATAGFMIYVTDAFGYLGTVGILLYKSFGQAELSWLSFFVGFSYVTCAVCSAGFAYSLFYFFRHPKARAADAPS